ncbi:DUF947-domain-containing protein [Hypoxylon rubiginosum]|uniref:DUF947-domain-containing protein n=1 Tax=Hypoxylon rubiginosum TaxID=110542 RepID=A0ACB9YT75_9PEZI|nr:DUF947-domain-containing protein [Hypoxylon rubiginosum]
MDRAINKKRKAPHPNLQRRVRARRDEPEPELDDTFSNEGQGEESNEDDKSEGGSEEAEEEEEEESGSSSQDEAEDPSAAASQISFGALAKAQANLPNIRRGKGRTEEEDEDEESDDSDDQPESKPTDRPRLPTPHRAHKHAPTEQTSKRPVTRKREAVPVPKREARDPRFSSATSSRPMDEDRARRAYAFLDEYRDSEMGQLRDTIRKTRDAGAKEELKRALASMQSRKQAQKQRDKENTLLEEHRRREKELVKQGKKPFYLKKSEQKKRLLVDRFEGLKGKQVDRVIERRRKKLASKERRDMPMPRARRDAE